MIKSAVKVGACVGLFVVGATYGVFYAVQVPESKLVKVAWLLKAAWKVAKQL